MTASNFGIYRPNSGNTVPNANDEPTTTTQIGDFLLQLQDYESTIPDAVTAHYLKLGGFESNDPRIIRLISLAVQKYISDISNDALQHCKARVNLSIQQGDTSKGNINNPKYTFTVDDLQNALQDYGVSVNKPSYFT